MKLFTKQLALVAFALAVTQSVNAATFDFVAEANKPYDAGVAGEQSFAEYNLIVDGITLKAQGKLAGSNDLAYAYLDSHWTNHGNAGLGVCQQFTTNCGSDDNVTNNEKLILDFGQQVAISEITMADGEHGTAFTGDFKLTIDGMYMGTRTLVGVFSELLTGQVFEFWNDNGTHNLGDEFYISTMTVSAIPIPAAIWLFGSVMLGFTAVRRNSKKTV